MNLFKYLGPSTLVTAAFIGPGTVTLCTLTGATSGYNLLWVLIFSMFTAIIFQEMAARLGLITQEGLGEAIRNSKINRIAKLGIILISFGAIIIGNAAYEAGNIAGAVLGLDLIYSGFTWWPLILGILAAFILYLGQYKLLEKTLILLVLLMSICFLITAFLIKPSPAGITSGFIPNKSDFSEILTIVGLIGTTVVPYNLFLHASSISEKYKSSDQLRQLRIENIIAIVLGGLISMTIIIVSAKVYSNGTSFSNISDFAAQLEPLLGKYSKNVMAIGFFAAGLSSAITAPLAAAYAANGLFDFRKNKFLNTAANHNYNVLKHPKFRLTWLSIIMIGVVVSMSGFKPVSVIKFAQIANGILLPIIAIFLIYVLNSKEIMGTYTNSKYRNVAAGIVLLLTIVMSIKTIISVFG